MRKLAYTLFIVLLLAPFEAACGEEAQTPSANTVDQPVVYLERFSSSRMYLADLEFDKRPWVLRFAEDVRKSTRFEFTTRNTEQEIVLSDNGIRYTIRF